MKKSKQSSKGLNSLPRSSQEPTAIKAAYETGRGQRKRRKLPQFVVDFLVRHGLKLGSNK